MVWEDEDMTLPEVAGVRVPRWAVYATLIVLTLVVSGFKLGVAVADHMAVVNDTQRRVQELEVRFCRLEAANHLAPWPTCPERIP